MTPFPDDEDALKVNQNPSSVDSLLARELNALDLKERTALHEEAHGLRNPFFVETPERMAKALSDLSDHLNRIPPDEKEMYLRSQKIPNSHIQTKAFLLRMLRCTGYDAQRAATKIAEICDVMVDLFGEIALERPIRLSDFSKKELQILRMGRIQFLPFGDRTGRRIIIYFADEVYESMSPLVRAKMAFYMSWVAVEDDESQKRGIVLIPWFDKEFKISMASKPKVLYRDHQLHSVRACAIHLCTPDTPLYQLRRAVLTVRLARARRVLRTHLGNSMENRYALQAFGIGVDQLPISYTGKIKLGYHRQWMGIRRIIENPNNSLPHEVSLIEYPKQDDVVFRQGSSCTNHSANIGFRSLIISKVKEQEQSRETPGIKIRRKKMVLDIINEVRVHGGRFLIWNENGGWNELLDEEIIHSKIEYLIKEFRKSVRVDLMKKRPQNVLSSQTSIFRSDYTTSSMSEQIANAGIPFDLQHEIDENHLLEAACCVVNCFGAENNNNGRGHSFWEANKQF